MTDSPPIRHRWKRRRWIAAAALWLLIAYTVGIGPVTYGFRRGWVPSWAAVPLLLPVHLALHVPVLRPSVDRYLRWWNVMALQHEGYEVRIDDSGFEQAHREVVNPR